MLSHTRVITYILDDRRTLHQSSFEPPHDITNKMCAQQRLRSAWASAIWSESLLCVQWVAKDPRFLHADSEDSDLTGRMPRLICVFAGHTLILLVLSCRGLFASYHSSDRQSLWMHSSKFLCLSFVAVSYTKLFSWKNYFVKLKTSYTHNKVYREYKYICIIVTLRMTVLLL